MKTVAALLIAAAALLWTGYEALVYYDDNFRYGRMRETPAVKPHEEPLLAMEAGVVPVSGGDGILMVLKEEAPGPPFDIGTDTVIERGESVYTTFCAQCHGQRYDGQGTVGQSFQPLPTDLRSPEVQDKRPADLFQTVSYGIPGGRQPPLHTTITVADRWHVVAFVKSLGSGM
jgi:hypothetical protein